MDSKLWPVGIRPGASGGLRLKIWRAGKLAYSETLQGDAYKTRDLAAAVKRRDELAARLRLGLPLFAGDDSENKLFSQAAQEYMDLLDAKLSTHLSYEQILNCYWLPPFGHWPVSEITKQDIRKELAALDVSPKTKRNVLMPLRCALREAGLNPNPAEGITIKSEQKEPIHRYTPKQRDLLLSKLSGQSLVYFTMLFGCGFRPGEALALRWTDYDGEQMTVSKQITRRKLQPYTKTNKQRTVYVSQSVRPILNEHFTRFQGGHIFLNTVGGPYLDTDVFNAEWKAAHKKARLPYRIPYVCRHTRASEMLSIGIEPAEAAKQLGHSLEMFFRIYAEWIEEFTKHKDWSRFEATTDKITTK